MGVVRGVFAAVVIAALFAGLVAVKILDSAGQLRPAPVQAFAGVCRIVAAPAGPEDIVVDRATGWAFVSSIDRRAALGGARVKGDIYAFFPSAQAPVFYSMAAGAPDDFRPHGLSLYRSNDGKLTLMAVNHSDAGDSVEIFDVTEIDGRPVLEHRRTVRDPAFVALNDVAAVAPDAFYATNDHTTPRGPLRTALDFLFWADGNVVFKDGRAAEVVARPLAYPNGVAVSADGTTVYVATTTGGALHAYTREPVSGALIRDWRLDLSTGLDNIDVQPDGALLIAAHPRLLDFVDHARDAARVSPSQVLRIEPATRRATTLWAGADLSGASVAAFAGETLVTGNVFDPKLLLCVPDAPAS